VFDLSIEKLLILAVVALFVLGPERLPAAATWLARTLRQIKNFC
jgi:sec-independent protein translocase protein TatB